MTFFNIFFMGQTVWAFIAGTLLFIAYCPRKKYFFIKFPLAIVVSTTVSAVLWYYLKSEAVFQVVGKLGMAVCNYFYVAELMLIFFLCFKCGFTELCTYVISGWVTQHFSWNLILIIAKAAGMAVDFVNYTWQFFVLTLATYAVVYFLVWLVFSRIRRNSTLITSKRILIPSVILLFVIIVLNIYAPYLVDTVDYVVLRLYAVSCCLVMLFLVFSAFKEGTLNYELDVLTQLERKKSQRYEMAKESVEVINTKCHDLKKLLEIITSNKTAVSDGEIAAISLELKRYESIIKTGNTAFDTILTEKSLFADKNQIKLTVMANVDALKFISDIDVYSLFANILDNAIEASVKLEPQKRIISLSVRTANDLLIIHSENCYEGELKFKDGRPVTIKSDADNHGFGILSIKRIAEKYGGDMTLTAEEGIFSTDIIIPLTDKKPQN